MNDWRERTRRAKRVMLSVAPPFVVPSPTLIERTRVADPTLYGDDIRGAYWDLISDGLLTRTENGVKRAPAED